MSQKVYFPFSPTREWQEIEKDNDPATAVREARKAYQENKKNWGRKYAGHFIAVYKGNVIATNFNEEKLLDWIIEEQKQKGPFRVCVIKIGSPGKKQKPQERQNPEERSKRTRS